MSPVAQYDIDLQVFSCDQAALRALLSVRLSVRPSVRPSVCLSVCLSYLFHYVPVIIPSWNFQELLLLTKVISMQEVNVRGQRSRSQKSWHHLAVSGLLLPFEFTYGNEMMHKAWCCLEEVPYCFSRSYVKCQGHTAKKSSILTQIRRFQTVTPVWIHQWLWNDAQSLKQHRRGALLFFKVFRQISRTLGGKIVDFDPNWAFPDCNSSLNSPMAMKCYTKLEEA